jgi:hypothetical protein
MELKTATTLMELKTATKCTAERIDVIKLITRASISSKQIILVHLKLYIPSKVYGCMSKLVNGFRTTILKSRLSWYFRKVSHKPMHPYTCTRPIQLYTCTPIKTYTYSIIILLHYLYGAEEN